jgi:hypothetical protein
MAGLLQPPVPRTGSAAEVPTAPHSTPPAAASQALGCGFPSSDSLGRTRQGLLVASLPATGRDNQAGTSRALPPHRDRRLHLVGPLGSGFGIASGRSAAPASRRRSQHRQGRSGRGQGGRGEPRGVSPWPLWRDVSRPLLLQLKPHRVPSGGVLVVFAEWRPAESAPGAHAPITESAAMEQKRQVQAPPWRSPVGFDAHLVLRQQCRRKLPLTPLRR